MTPAQHLAAPSDDGPSKLWQSSARTHVGKVRQLNEDRYLDIPESCLWVVADGMGGHDAGDMAAAGVVQALARLCEADASVDIGKIEETLSTVNQDLYAEMQQRGQVGGCTVAGLHLDGEQAHIFWAGDSRVYRLRERMLERLTHDHSVVQQMIDAGLLDARQAKTHPQANVITRAIGVDQALRLETRTVRVDGLDRFLICSDGVTNELTEAQLADCLLATGGHHADAIMARTLESRARDNLTLIEIF